MYILKDILDGVLQARHMLYDSPMLRLELVACRDCITMSEMLYHCTSTKGVTHTVSLCIH